MTNANKEVVTNYLNNTLTPNIDIMNEDQMVNTFFEEAERVIQTFKTKEKERVEPYVTNRWKRYLNSRLVE